MHNVDKLIWEKFRIKKNDNLPYRGWAKYGRNELAQLMGEAGFKTGAEIGVASGKFSEILCKSIPNLKLYSIDPWTAYNYVKQARCDKRYLEAKHRLDAYDVELIKKTSMAACGDFENESLDFVYLDGCHSFDYIMTDLIIWEPKVKIGGMVAGHDYYEFFQSGVIDAVRAYTFNHNIFQWYVTREKEPSYFWVKTKPNNFRC
jgi:hypothetical protein